MDIQRIDSSLVRIPASTDPSGTPVRLVLGERVTAQISGRLADGRLLLDVKGQTLEARSTLPLSPGQSVDLEVAGMGAEVTLRVLGGDAIVSEQRLALGTLSAAHASLPVTPPADVSALLRALDVDLSSLSDGQRSELSRLLGPMRAGTTPGALAEELQHVIENGGLLFESRVRAWLASASRTTLSLPAELGSDLKVLLGVLGRALGSLGQASTSGDDAKGIAWQAEHGRVRDELLTRQIETAYHWVRDGALSLQLPLAFGDQIAQAHLRFQRDDVEVDREADDRTAPGMCTFDLALEPPGLGPLRAHVAWAGAHLRVQFFVAVQDTAARILPALPELSAALARTGFSKVDAEVLVDAARSRLASLEPMTPPEGGTIVNVRA